MTINLAGITLVKEFEGFSDKAYKCPAGVWTLGYGHTEGVKEGDKITMRKAHDLLADELNEYAEKVEALCKFFPNQNQLAALTSLAYNIGITGFSKSTVLKRHNVGDYEAAARAFSMWNKASGKVLPGLVRRRAAEAALYMTSVSEAADPMPQKIDEEVPVTSSVQINAGSVTVLTSMMGVAAQVAQHFKDITEGFGEYLPYVALGAACVAAIAGGVVVIRRLQQRQRGEA